MPFRYKEAMVEPPVEKEPVEDPFERYDYEVDMFDEVLDSMEEYIKRYNAKRKKQRKSFLDKWEWWNNEKDSLIDSNVNDGAQ